MQPSAPKDEDELQYLIASHPETIAGRGEPLILVKREQSVPDKQDGAARFSLDNLFVTQAGEPVLVEVKQAKNTQIRREVVGQLLDYAANGSAYWEPGTLEAAFRAQSERDGRDPDELLREFLADTGPLADPAQFWVRVDDNLASGRMRLVIVADRIPRELARIVEFLNEQMDKATVLAVELTYYIGEKGLRTLVPKVIGETERGQSATGKKTLHAPPPSIEEWLSIYASEKPDFNTACQRLIDTVCALEGTVKVETGTHYLIMDWGTPDKSTARLLYMTNVKGRVAICFGNFKKRPKLADSEIRQSVYQGFHDIFGTLSTTNINGFPSFDVTALNDDNVLLAFREQLGTLAGLATQV